MLNLHSTSASLLLIDWQQNLLATINQSERVTNNCLKLIDGLLLFDLPIITTEQYRRLMGPTINQITEKLPSCEPLAKMSFNCCNEPEFNKALKVINRKSIIVAGIETHVCVLQTALSLQESGYQVYLATDACGSRTTDDYQVGIDLMRQAGVIISSCETIIFQLLQTARADEYKKIIKLIKSS